MIRRGPYIAMAAGLAGWLLAMSGCATTAKNVITQDMQCVPEIVAAGECLYNQTKKGLAQPQ